MTIQNVFHTIVNSWVWIYNSERISYFNPIFSLDPQFRLYVRFATLHVYMPNNLYMPEHLTLPIMRLLHFWTNHEILRLFRKFYILLKFWPKFRKKVTIQYVFHTIVNSSVWIPNSEWISYCSPIFSVDPQFRLYVRFATLHLYIHAE